MEICGALCYEVVILVVAQQKVDTRVFLDVNLADAEFRLVQDCQDRYFGTCNKLAGIEVPLPSYLRTLQGPPAFVYA
jgi:hypothetical protein